tara:strand:- start:565 stop:1368 length:804 start_codon:yes stop_codon:yes gene_type:complete
MKHEAKVIVALMVLFFSAQIIGLIIVDQYQVDDALPLNIERPDIEPENSYVQIFLFIIIATALALVLLKFKFFKVWKFWFLLSVFLTLAISFNAFIVEWLAIVLAIVLALWKIFKPQVYVHNLTELFIYGALAAVFVPILNIISISVLLILISVYDYIAVRKTKHMVALAKSQEDSKVFAGLMIPYGKKNVAILGGGDIGFPLIFSAVVMVQLGFNFTNWQSYIIPVCAGLMLLALFLKGEKKKFYPAMPYISLGCFLGLGILLLIL